MSQIERGLAALLTREPEIEKCYRKGLVNRRALARYAVRNGVAAPEEFDAVVAAIRRHDFGDESAPARDLFPQTRLGLRDHVVVVEYRKDPELLRRVERVVAHVDYSRGETVKVVIGTSAIKLFLDEAREESLRGLLDKHRPVDRQADLSEVSMRFPAAATMTPNVLAVLTRELAMNEVVIAELLTASPELLVYLHDEYVPRAYEVIRRLRSPTSSGPHAPADRTPRTGR